MKRAARPWLVACAVVVLAVVVRVVVSGQGALAEGRAALERGDELGAALYLGEAIGWELPVAPWQEAAAEELWALHERQAERGDLEGAVRSLTLLRGGLMSARSLFGVDEAWRGRVDPVLARLMARWEAQIASAERRAVPGSLDARTAFYGETLRRDAMPARGWGLLAVLGFALWFGAAWRATGGERFRWRAMGVSVIGLAAFLVGVGLA